MAEQLVPHIRYQKVWDHQDLDEDTYHQWVFTGEPVKADKHGRPNPRMQTAAWALIRCNNVDCIGYGYVHTGDIADALDEVDP